MAITKNWEMFYTNSKTDEDLVDQISIDVRNKRYVIDIDANDMVTDGYDEDDEPIESSYVSRFVFDIIVAGVKAKGFAKYVHEYEDDEDVDED